MNFVCPSLIGQFYSISDARFKEKVGEDRCRDSAVCWQITYSSYIVLVLRPVLFWPVLVIVLVFLCFANTITSTARFTR